MGSRFYVPDRMQTTLMPACIDDWIGKDHMARFISEIVDEMNMDEFYAGYNNKGTRAYDPRMLLALMIYGYTQGIVSSRKLETATYDSVAFRYLSGNLHPDHTTIATFRKRFLPQIEGCFKQVLQIAQKLGLVKVGNIFLDGTKVKANASKHKAMSYSYMEKAERELEKEIQELLARADLTDEQEKDADQDLPDELKLRQDRLEKITWAKKELEERARQRDAEEQLEYERKKEAWEEKERKRQRRGTQPQPPKDLGPRDKDQCNFTDSESRIMKTQDGFQQCYNAQAAVTDDRLIVALQVSNQPNDYGQLLPTLDRLPKEMGTVENLIADNGYLSKANESGCLARQIKPHLSLGREGKKQKPKKCFQELHERMTGAEGKELYRKRKFTVEPVFGVIKEAMGFRRFSLRGLENVQGEWALVCLAYNIKKIFNMKNGQNDPISLKNTMKIARMTLIWRTWFFSRLDTMKYV